MKVKVLLALCFFGLVNAASAHRIVEIYRSGGLFGYYSDVRQTFMGYFSGGAEWWVLECTDPGFVKCKLRPSAGKTVRQGEIEEIEDNKLSDLMLEIETGQIANNVTTGSQTKHYQSTLSDNSVIDIYIAISWRPDPNGSGKTLFHADITNSDD